ncbi:hypothetical protein AtubIFM57258_000819 [Aspergillus tubingensis]|nr:hypothetical protein AtubIFM57258_000819 [Aspergillus tubingensis]
MATCYIGQHTIAAQVLIQAAHWMVHRCYQKYYDGNYIDGIENASCMRRPIGVHLSRQIRRLRGKRCKDPRDRVYSVLGLSNPQVADRIVPDYTIPAVTVYAHALRLAFEEDGGLQILHFLTWWVEKPTKRGALMRLREILRKMLCLSRGTVESQRWPSWVLKLHASTDSAYGSCLNTQVFEKSDWPFQTRSLNDPLVLSVKGLVVTHVTYTSEVFSSETLWNGKRLAPLILRCVKQTNRLCHKHGNSVAQDDLNLTFICGINGLCLDLDADETLASEYQEFVDWCKSASESGREQFSPRYLNNMGRSLNRRFFTTANGLIGMGVPNTQAGDYLCILSGSPGCFVMRQEGSHWKIIGDAYSRRLMKRVYVDEIINRNEWEKQSQWFNIWSLVNTEATINSRSLRLDKPFT